METIDFAQRPQSLTKTARFINFLLHWAIRIALAVMGVDFKLANRNILPKKGPVIIVGAPHTSLADALFMIASIRRTYAGIGMAELRSAEWPWIIRKGFDWLGHIPIDRGNSVSGDSAIDAGLHALFYGGGLAVWPHGRQIQEGKPETWFTGYARFAKASGAMIYVYKIAGAEDFWPTHPDGGGPQGFNWNAKVRAAFSGPIDPADYASVEELDIAFRRIHASLELPD